MPIMLYVTPRSSPKGPRGPVKVVENDIDIDILWQSFLLGQIRLRAVNFNLGAEEEKSRWV